MLSALHLQVREMVKYYLTIETRLCARVNTYVYDYPKYIIGVSVNIGNKNFGE